MRIYFAIIIQKIKGKKMKIMNASGRLIDPFNLQEIDFDPRIIAQTLSRICRFWGQTSEYYSVAQHCLTMEKLFDNTELKKWAMIHEVFEGLTGMDVPSPIKHSIHMTDYRIAEDKAIKQASKIFNLKNETMPSIIKEADKRLLVTEALRFMNTTNYDWEDIAKPYPIKTIGTPLSMKKAEIAFLNKWYELFS